jgi:tetratricopeptide (TPR) repeat protein
MNLNNRWKRICFKLKHNLPQASLRLLSKPPVSSVGSLSLSTVGLSLLLLSGSMRLTASAIASEQLAQSLPALKPTQPAAVEQLNQGIAFVQQGKLPEAIAAFRQASQLNPQLAPAHYNLGLALRQSGQLQASADAFYKATQADPNFALGVC